VSFPAIPLFKETKIENTVPFSISVLPKNQKVQIVKTKIETLNASLASGLPNVKYCLVSQ
jgi:hypothetical protein